MYGHHWTPLEVDGAVVVDKFSLDSALMGCEQRAEKVCLCENGVGRRCGVVGLLSNE